MSSFSKPQRNNDSRRYTSTAGSIENRETTTRYEPPNERIQFNLKSCQGSITSCQFAAKTEEGAELHLNMQSAKSGLRRARRSKGPSSSTGKL